MAIQTKVLKVTAFYLGIGTEKAKNNDSTYSVGNFYDRDSEQNFSVYLSEGVKDALAKLPKMSDVELVFGVNIHFDRIGLILQGVSVVPIADKAAK